MDDKLRRSDLLVLKNAPLDRMVVEGDTGPVAVGDVLTDLVRLGELPAAGALTRPSTTRSLRAPNRSSSTMRSCSCDGFGLLVMVLADALAEQQVVVDSYEAAGKTVALVPCVCEAGRERAERWRGLPEEATGVRLRGGRVKSVAAQVEALKAIKAFIKQPRGWVTFAGGYGVGKTTLIYAALNHLADRGVYGRYVMMPELLDKLRGILRRDDQTYASVLRQVITAPILAVDELDKIRDSDFVDEVLHAIFLARYQDRARLGTLIGYNLDGAANIPPFLASRIRDGRFRLIEMTGVDLRPIADKLDPWETGEDPHA